ncbi:MAG TPA: hypothetical protein VK196_02915, partial [Magnetospirillum sp.]|nr:hypothetical protein [Magnetospirillum sp.]
MRITATNEELRNEVLARYVAATSGDAGAEVAREFDAWLAADPRRRQVAEALRLPEDDTRALRVLFADEIRTLRRRRVRRRGAWLGVACAVAAAIAVIVGGH